MLDKIFEAEVIGIKTDNGGRIDDDKISSDGYVTPNDRKNLIIRDYLGYGKQSVEIQLGNETTCVNLNKLIAYLTAVVDSKRNNKF